MQPYGGRLVFERSCLWSFRNCLMSFPLSISFSLLLNFVNCVCTSFIFHTEKIITQTKNKRNVYYWGATPSSSIVKTWCNECCGCTSTSDAQQSGCLNAAATPETIAKIHDMMLFDWRLRVHEIVEASGISHGPAASILNDRCHVCPGVTTNTIV